MIVLHAPCMYYCTHYTRMIMQSTYMIRQWVVCSAVMPDGHLWRKLILIQAAGMGEGVAEHHQTKQRGYD